MSLVAAACGSDAGGGGAPGAADDAGGGGAPGVADAAVVDAAVVDAGAAGSLGGMVGGTAFRFQSGLAYVDAQGALDLVFSDAASVCTSMTTQKFHAGETLVQAYNLKGTVPGTFAATIDDVKYATVNPTCASGQPLQGNVGASGRATKSEFTITTITETAVEGSLNLTFDDASTLSGSFHLPICSASDADKATCL